MTEHPERERVQQDIERILSYLRERQGQWVHVRKIVFELELFAMRDIPPHMPISVQNMKVLLNAMVAKPEFRLEAYRRVKFRAREGDA